MDHSGNYAMYNGSESQPQLPLHPPQMTYGTSTYQRDNSLSQPVFQFVPSQSPLVSKEQNAAIQIFILDIATLSQHSCPS
jgi:hypothetical protein